MGQLQEADGPRLCSPWALLQTQKQKCVERETSP